MQERLQWIVARARASLADTDLAQAVQALHETAPGPQPTELAIGLISALLRADVGGRDHLRYIDDLVAIVDREPPPGPHWMRLRASGRAMRLIEAAGSGTVVDVPAALRELDELAAAAGEFPPVRSLLDLARTALVLSRPGAAGDRAMMTDLPDRIEQLVAGLPSEAAAVAEPLRLAAAAVAANASGDEAALRRAVDAFVAGTDALPSESPVRAAMADAVLRLQALRGSADTAELVSRLAREDRSEADRAADHLTLAGALMDGGDQSDIGRIDEAIEHARRAAGLTRPGTAEHLAAVVLVGIAMMRRSEVGGGVAGLAQAGADLDEASAGIGPDHPQWTLVNEVRGGIQARLAQHAPSHRTRLDSQRGYAWRILLQPDPRVAIREAHDAARDAIDLARQCLGDSSPTDAIRALETGRGLLLFAATQARRIPLHLRHSGRDDLAARWSSAAASGVDEELRREVLEVLSRDAAAQARLLDPPTLAEIRSALSTVDADALVYLFPADPPLPGAALIAPVDGPVTYLALPNLTTDDRQVARYLDALDRRAAEVVRDIEGAPHRDLAPSAAEVAASLPELCRWAWLAAIGPLLGQYVSRRPNPARGRVPRVILVPVADLARVPWAAARDEEGRYAVHFAAFSQIPSARLLCDIAARPPLSISPVGLVVGDPPTHGTPLKAARLEAYAIRQAYYPGARFVGRRPDGSLSPSGAGTAEQVRRWLAEPDPLAGSMLHLACHATCRTEAEGASSYLQLAADGEQPGDGGALGARELVELAARAGHRDLALVVLAACNTGRSVYGYDEAYSLGSGFLVGGTRSVLCTQWSIPDDETSALMFMFHHFLRHDRQPVWAALREAQLWMLDPNRQIPDQMPAQLRPPPSPVEVTAWAGFVHWGQ